MSDHVVLAVRLVSSDLLWTAIAALLAVAPGLGLALGLSRRLGWGWPSVLVLSITVSSALAGVAGLVSFMLHTSLLAASLAFMALAAGAWAGGIRLGRGRPAPALERSGLIAGGVAALVAIVQGPYMGVTGDTFYHLAAIRSLLVHDAPMVTDPFYGTNVATLDPTSGIWHTMIAMWSRLSTLDPVGLWIGVNAVGAAGLVLALWALLRWVSGSAKWATWGVGGYVVVSLFLDFRTAGLPRNGALLIAFTAVLAFLSLLEERRWSAVAVAVIGGFAASTVHLGAALLLYLSVASLMLWVFVETLVTGFRERRWDWRPLGALLGAGLLVALTAASTLAPKLVTMSTTTAVGEASAGMTSAAFRLPTRMGGQLVKWPGGLVSIDPGSLQVGGTILFALAIVFIVLMAVAAFGHERSRPALGGLALVGLPLLLLYNPIVGTVLYRLSPYGMERIAALMPFASWVGVAWGLARVGRERLAVLARWAAVACLVFALAMSAPYTWNTWTGAGGKERKGARYPVYVTRLIDMRYEWGLDTLATFRAAVGDRYPRIAGDLLTTYYMTGLAPVSTLAAFKSHSPFSIEQANGEERRTDNAEIIAPGTSDVRRRFLLDKWEVDYVVVLLDRPEPLASAEALRRSSVVRALVESRTLIVFEVRR